MQLLGFDTTHPISVWALQESRELTLEFHHRLSETDERFIGGLIAEAVAADRPAARYTDENRTVVTIFKQSAGK